MSKQNGRSSADSSYGAEESDLIRALQNRLQVVQRQLSEAQVSAACSRSRAQEHRASADSLADQRQLDLLAIERVQVSKKRAQRQISIFEGQVDEAGLNLQSIKDGTVFRHAMPQENTHAIEKELRHVREELLEQQAANEELHALINQESAKPPPTFHDLPRPAWCASLSGSSCDAASTSLRGSSAQQASPLTPRTPTSSMGSSSAEVKKVRMVATKLSRETDDLQMQLRRERNRAENLVIREDAVLTRGRQLEACLQRCREEHAQCLQELEAELRGGNCKVRGLLNLATHPCYETKLQCDSCEQETASPASGEITKSPPAPGTQMRELEPAIQGASLSYAGPLPPRVRLSLE